MLASYVLHDETRQEDLITYARGRDLFDDIESARRRIGRPVQRVQKRDR